MPLDPARVLSAYLRAQVYRAHGPDPKPAPTDGERPPGTENAPHGADPVCPAEEKPPAGPGASLPVAETGPAAPRGAPPARPGLFARLLLYVRQE
ncbi:hypothetical protein [Streptomyces hiroshimensis]|uniref:Uncharacterized protein n=1 Tax=Streptomyces hiroshimensis TaxID=66424 RepID=A0ABQ2Z4D4_9ACTN|nr:hypothetical protein [Streptomyces hiroshimensis]GGY02132.1 hypothetical protein GCM10010324_56300 [Streptomyces hiroshimensis]